ncbi:F-box/kelch-repeat protein At1g23390 [Juglans microcarpa x Juglans regia]|uniref:F-box/kelch-repeat protein At1g23390 n=1 Tax=Juglans microcarpa x Juglans regia TaxID=2249226 RepID=UPI001B7EB604|nr:F-box/kelch-repeat protein At1g23390 [Juglans microcarpa x Juglans regia]
MEEEKKLELEEAPIFHGDVLEAVLSRVPLIDLVPACQVSKPWESAVVSSLRHLNPIKPWLIVHTQTTRHPYATTTHAYDPRSDLWVEIEQPPIKHVSVLRSSHSTLLYMQSPFKFAFSFDPLHLMWHLADAPIAWRTDPIVALVGQHIVVAGGGCDFGDDPIPMETYDLRTGTWETCESMPSILKDSAASTSLSIAVDEQRMYVTEKTSGMTHSFDPSTKTWHGPYNLRPGTNVFSPVIGFVHGRMVVVGLIGDAENVKGVKLWEVSKGTETVELREVGEMPKELVEKLKGKSPRLPYIAMTSMGNLAYLHNPSEPGELILCEVTDGSKCKWGSVRNVVVNEVNRMQTLALTCSNVGLGDLQAALSSGDRRFIHC